MVTDYLNGKLIISNIHDEFNIVSRDWESRAPRWIYDALQNLKISLQAGNITKAIDFTNYQFELPCRMEVLRDIFINEIKLEYTGTTGHELIRKKLKDEGITDLRYYSVTNGIVTLEIEKGTANVVYTNLPLDWDDELGMWIPKIPNVPEVIENIKWYVLKIILARGYKHPVYSLVSQNPYNNPDIRWQQTIGKAKRAARAISKEQRANMADIMSEFIADPNTSINDLISEQYRTDLNIEE